MTNEGATLADVGCDEFTPSQKAIIVAIINNYGSHDHPSATDSSLPFFRIGYVRECLNKALPNLNDEGKAIIEPVLKRLGKPELNKKRKTIPRRTERRLGPLRLTIDKDNGFIEDVGHSDWLVQKQTPSYSQRITTVDNLAEIIFMPGLYEDGNKWVALVMAEGMHKPEVVQGDIASLDDGVHFVGLEAKLNSVLKNYTKD